MSTKKEQKKANRRRTSSADEKFLQEFPDEPIPLLHFDEAEDKLQVNEHAMTILQKIEGKIAVIAMAGLYRTGKSSMLNWLLGRQNGFRVGPTIERCTRGIWLWGKPKKHILANGEDCYVLMLDTEGLGGLEASQQYDVRIFSLATLLCSKLVYNSQGSVDEKAVNNLSFIANMTKHIRVNAGSEETEDNGEEFSSFFPSFLWIVRDFTLDLVDEDGDAISSNEYLEKALAPQQGYTPAVMERNRVRHMMTAFFKERECVTLVRPVHDENMLQQVDQIPILNLRKEFQQQLSALKQQVFDNLTPKMVNQKPLNGAMFSGLLVAYVDAINNNSVPTISSAWEGVTNTECKKSMHTAMDYFQNEFSNLELPLDPEEMTQSIKKIETLTLEMYRKNAIGDMSAKYEQELQSKIDTKKSEFRAKNKAIAKETCERLLQTLYNEIIQPRLTDESNTFQNINEFGKEWNKFRERYLQRAKGAVKHELLLAFAEVKYGEMIRYFLSRQEDEYETQLKHYEGENSKIKESMGSIQGREIIYKQQIESIQQDTSSLMSEKSRLEAELESANSVIDDLKYKINNENHMKQNLEVEKDAMNLRLSTIMSHHDEKNDELMALSKKYQALMQEKEKKEIEMGLMNAQVEQLREKNNCGCTIQ